MIDERAYDLEIELLDLCQLASIDLVETDRLWIQMNSRKEDLPKNEHSQDHLLLIVIDI